MNQPVSPEIDRDKLAEVALSILSLTLHGGGRVWKSLDWDLMDLLHEKGWVVDPRSKAKSVVLTEDGERLAREFLHRYFANHGTTVEALTVGGTPPEPAPAGGGANSLRQYEQSRPGAVLYAKSVDCIVTFYSAVLGFQIGGADEGHVVLESPAFQLVVLRIPQEIASSIAITAPPTRRVNAAIKPVFVVPSIATARATAEAYGGALNSIDTEWYFQGFTVCDGHDPEGNVIQFREPAG